MTAIAVQQPFLRDTRAAAYISPSAMCNEVDRARSELFVEFIRSINAAGISYCLLSGYESYPFASDSDIDFMVQRRDRPRIAPLLRDVAARCHGLFVQAIQHETSACYYVLAKQVENEVGYLHPDCTTDYRRKGRLWLAADAVIGNRRRLGTFFVPAIADEFQYYLIKKILKRSITRWEFQRVAALYVRHPEQCCERLRFFLTKETTGAVVSALVRRDYEWMHFHLRYLLEELQRSAPQESRQLRGLQLLGEWRRRISRVSHPTGLAICVCGGNAEQRSELAAALEPKLRPAFRRTRIIAEEHFDGAWAPTSMQVSKVRSTLIVRTAPGPRWCGSHDICFDLSNTDHLTAGTATRLVLKEMSKRLQRQRA